MSFGRQIVDLAAAKKPADIKEIASKALEDLTFDVVSQMRDELIERGITLKGETSEEITLQDEIEEAADIVDRIKDMSADQMHAQANKRSAGHDSYAGAHAQRLQSSGISVHAAEAHRDADNKHQGASNDFTRVHTSPLLPDADNIGKESQFRIAIRSSAKAYEASKRAAEVENRQTDIHPAAAGA